MTRRLLLLSGNALIHQFTRIGRLAMISGGAAIGKDVPPFCTAHGVAVSAKEATVEDANDEFWDDDDGDPESYEES